VAPIPPLFLEVIKHLKAASVLSPSETPDSCTVDIYNIGQYAAPRVDSFKFARPFTTVSFLSEAPIVFADTMHELGEGEFGGDGKC
jgi:hypothetical protein